MRNYILYFILNKVNIFGVNADDETVIPEIQLLNGDFDHGSTDDLQRMSRKYRKVKRLEAYPEEKHSNSEADIIQGKFFDTARNPGTRLKQPRPEPGQCISGPVRKLQKVLYKHMNDTVTQCAQTFDHMIDWYLDCYHLEVSKIFDQVYLGQMSPTGPDDPISTG